MVEPIRFYTDENVGRSVASGLRRRGIVYAHQRTSVGDIIRGLMLIYHVMGPADMQNHVEFL